MILSVQHHLLCKLFNLKKIIDFIYKTRNIQCYRLGYCYSVESLLNSMLSECDLWIGRSNITVQSVLNYFDEVACPLQCWMPVPVHSLACAQLWCSRYCSAADGRRGFFILSAWTDQIQRDGHLWDKWSVSTECRVHWTGNWAQGTTTTCCSLVVNIYLK